MGFTQSKFRRQEPPLTIPPSHQLPPPAYPAPSTLPPPPPRAAAAAAAPPPSRPSTPTPPPLPPLPGAYPSYQCSPYPPQPHPHPHHQYSHYYNAAPRNYGYGYGYGGYNAWAGGSGTSGMRPRSLPPPPPPPAPVPFVEQKQAKKVKNEVNVHKDSIKVTVDGNGLDASYFVSFTFDALVDGSFTIFYFAKEGANCTFSPVYPEIHTPQRFPFQKGAGQKFYQPSETGIDLGFFDVQELAKPSSNEEIFPLAICAETSHTSLIDNLSGETSSTVSSNSQITQAVLERDNCGYFQVRVVKQILWNEGVRYELREIYGISASSSNAEETGFEDNDPGKECVICMTEPKDTAVMPCRHMCMCSECAKELRLQSNKCPICRQPIQELIEIKVK